MDKTLFLCYNKSQRGNIIMEVISVGKSHRLYKSFPEHQHGYWEILLNIKGSGVINVEGVNYKFKPGSIIVIPPYTPHKKESEEGFMDISMFINNMRPIGKTPLKFFTDDKEKSVQKVMEIAALYSYPKEMDNHSKFVLAAAGDFIYQILACFYNQYSRRDARLEGILKLIHQNVSNPDFDLAKTIGDAGFSRSYFRKIFKDETGNSPVAYFNCLRINQAKMLMQQYGGSRTVKDVALECGFKDALYFSRVFKKVEGVSPSQYLKEIQNPDRRPIFFDTPESLYKYRQ